MDQPVRGDTTRLRVFGEVAAGDGHRLMRAILQAVARSDDRRVVVDLSDAVVDAEIIEVLLTARNAARVVCRDLTFTGAPSEVRHLLRRDDVDAPAVSRGRQASA
ncbi:hypothetical protein R8Z50_19555 [Longispora sp. K20-0274]|uniref:STAS domain-containing protein n=1 Tax=Longispora sp. K20-0274 TaxID=3088255 RepID=UPI003999FA36